VQVTVKNCTALKLRDNSESAQITARDPAPRAADALLLQPETFARHDAPHGAI
jgi:hypothetical protein